MNIQIEKLQVILGWVIIINAIILGVVLIIGVDSVLVSVLESFGGVMVVLLLVLICLGITMRKREQKEGL